MILTAAVKVFSDLCLYFAAISITVPRFYPGTTLLFLGALCSVGVALATLSHRHPVFRFLGILPPLAGLLLSSHPRISPSFCPPPSIPCLRSSADTLFPIETVSTPSFSAAYLC